MVLGTSRRPSPLPVMLTPIVGRERESGELRDLLLDHDHRIVTVTGPAGVGKTRLALDVADSLLNAFDDDVAFVQLASVQDARLIFPSIGQAFGLLADVAVGYEAQLIDLLRNRRVLILLDNCEQIRDVAVPIMHLLAGAPEVFVLATSQAPIGIAGEQLYPLAPLSTPSEDQSTVEDIARSDAVALFLSRARAVNPNLLVNDTSVTAIAEICRYLDGLPLAIELAAARTNVLSPPALLARLSNRLEVLGGERQDVPDRLRTMRHAISWSYDLLAAEEQWLFRHLAVFEDRFSLESVESTFEQQGSMRSAIDVLGTLVDRSLIRRSSRFVNEDRYFMLQTLRDFGLEQLETLGEMYAARMAHAEVMVQLAETAEPHLISPDQDIWLDRLDADRGNLRAAVEWALANGREEIVFRIAGAIWRFCAARGLITECRAWLDRAFAAQGNHLTPHRVKALIGAGNLAEDHRDLDVAERLFTQARHLAAAIGDTHHECRALIGLGTVAHDRSNYEPALALHNKALALARQIGDTRSIAVTLANLGAVSYYLARPEDAIRYWEESRGYMVELGDKMSEAVNASNLGALLSGMEDYGRAEKYLERALALQRQMNVQRDLPFTLINLGEVARELGDFTLAHDCFAESIDRLREFASPGLLGVAYNGDARLSFAEGDDAGAASKILESARLVGEDGDRLPVIENTELLAEIFARRGAMDLASELIAAADHFRQEIGAPRYAARQKALQCIREAASTSLDAAALADARRAGEKLDIPMLVRRVMSLAREVVGRQKTMPLITAPVPEAEPEAASPDVDYRLTPREIEVLALLAQGNSTTQIAEQLFVSPRTATTHINNILGKLGVSSRTAAVALALRHNLLS